MSAICKGLFVAAICLGLRAEGDIAGRLAALERTMDRFYRGESIEEAVDQSNRAIQAFNAHASALQAKSEKERKHIQELLRPLENKREQLGAMDRHLKQVAGDLSREETRNLIRARNDLARQIDEETAQVGQATKEFNARTIRIKSELDSERQKTLDFQAQVNRRLAEYEAFTRSGQDVAFFRELNGLLAEVREALRAGASDPQLQDQLSRIRGFRRELAAWAIRSQSRRPNGLVIVEATLVDEPCWLVLDTGAMDTIVSEELLQATGSNHAIQQEKSLSVIGGLRVPGLACRIPRLTVAGQTLSGIPGSVVPPSDVGVDGLLGQTFLRAFVYTVDDRTPAKLTLIPK